MKYTPSGGEGRRGEIIKKIPVLCPVPFNIFIKALCLTYTSKLVSSVVPKNCCFRRVEGSEIFRGNYQSRMSPPAQYRIE